MNTKSTEKNDSEEIEKFISFKEIILSIQALGRELYLQKWWIGTVAMIMAGVFYLSNRIPQIQDIEETYSASLIFMLTENNGREAGTVLGKHNNIAIKRMLKLAKTKNIIYKVLFNKVIINEKEDFVANHLIDLYRFHRKWRLLNTTETQQLYDLSTFYFEHGEITEFTPKMHQAAQSISALLPTLIHIRYDGPTNFLELHATTNNEELSLLLSQKMYQEIHNFYLQDVIEKPKYTFNFLQARSDSILTKLTALEADMANYNRHQGFLSNEEHLTKIQLTRQVSFLTATYRELIKSKEAILFRLQSQTSLLRIIDQTYPPLSPNITSTPEENKLKQVIIGAITGAILAILWFILRKSYRKLMAD